MSILSSAASDVTAYFLSDSSHRSVTSQRTSSPRNGTFYGHFDRVFYEYFDQLFLIKINHNMLVASVQCPDCKTKLPRALSHVNTSVTSA